MENTIETAINNLEMMSDALEKAANNPKHYNTDFSYYLEQLSWEMHKNARELKERKELFSI